jgi:hypothetical protein
MADARVDLAKLWERADDAYIHDRHLDVLVCLQIACTEAKTLAAEVARLRRVVDAARVYHDNLFMAACEDTSCPHIDCELARAFVALAANPEEAARG